jgi:hypothetical protein
VDLVPNHHGERTIFAKMSSSFRRRETEATSVVVRPASNGQHISGEKLSMQRRPSEELAFGLIRGIPDLLRHKTRVASHKLGVVGGASAVLSIGGEGPRNGVGLVRRQL